ncbi:lariat debranching enzyme [Kickxella alabastrina]|uniref:Lariat debranching enzyme n=1 Tax=Kickxella alabastrina TaxID=61397 RepID=A0ACC1IBY9_9FUNG|nr:lariat debranching enzyme [Kickxella alabastrina]
MGRAITIAVEGCCHGMLDDIYAQMLTKSKNMGKRVDLLIICGDFQAIRNVTDLECMACPDKYKQLGGFYRYYTGERVAPIPTIFVGGNHEAGNHMRELYYGGWVAPNIYFMGNSGVVKFGGLRIGGVSGIYKDHDFVKGYYERPPFRGHARSSMHHVRSYEAFKMMQIRKPLDIVVSHDWPQNIERFGDTEGLLRRKPFFRQEIGEGRLGSPVNALLLERLRPAWWFSAHMHSRFEAQVGAQNVLIDGKWSDIAPYHQHESTVSQTMKNQDEIVIGDLSDDDEYIPAAVSSRPALNLPPPKNSTGEPALTLDSLPDTDTGKDTDTHQQQPKNTNYRTCESATLANVNSVPDQPEHKVSDPCVPGRATRFLALDKCLPNRKFLEIIDIEVEDTTPDNAYLQLEYDPEWLAILRMCHPYMPLNESPFFPPSNQTKLSETAPSFPAFSDSMLDRELAWVHSNVFRHGRVFIPPNFVPMASVPPPGTPDSASFGLAANQSGGNRGGRGGRGGHGGDRGCRRGGHFLPRDIPWEGQRPSVINPNPQTDELCMMLGIQDNLTQRRY